METKILLVSIMLIPQYSNAGIDQLTGFLRGKGYSVDIAYFHNNDSADNIKQIISLEYDYYGFCVDITNIDKCYEIVNYIKSVSTAQVFFGGAFVASCYRDIFEDCAGVDYIILGSGEEPILYLLNNIDNKELENHPNIASRKSMNDKSIHENTRFDFNFAEDYYIRYSASNSSHIHCLQTKNNTCTGSCSFCINWCLKRKRLDLHYRSTDSIVSEIKRINNLYGIKHFFFTDDDLVDPCTRQAKDRILNLCKAIIEANLKVTFGCYLKANSLLDCDGDQLLLDYMYRAGFVFAFVGIESGCNSDLALYRKIANVEDNKRSINLLYKYNIKPDYEMIVFHPYSTLDSIKENFYFLEEFKSFNIRHYSSSSISIYKNTAIWKKALDDGLLNENYSYKTPNGYNFVDNNVAQISKFLWQYFIKNPDMSNMITADQLVSYYYRFSRYSNRVREMEKSIKKVQQENFELLNDYFSNLYVKNDIAKCQLKFDSLYNKLKSQENNIQTLINKMIKMNIEDN